MIRIEIDAGYITEMDVAEAIEAMLKLLPMQSIVRTD